MDNLSGILPGSYPPSPSDEPIGLEHAEDMHDDEPGFSPRAAAHAGAAPAQGSPGKESGSGPSCDSVRPKDLREKNKYAQRRYRAKKKEQLTATRKQMEELTTRLTELALHNTELQRRQRLMTSVAAMQEEHLCRMKDNQVVREVEADILLEELTRLMSKVEQRPVSAAEAKGWTIDQWMTMHFRSYIGRLTALLPEAKAKPHSAAAQEMVELVTMRRAAELRSSMFSSLYWSLWAWNVHNTPQTPANDPTRTSDCNILGGLDLTPQQTKDILAARARLLFRLGEVAQQRTAALSALGLETLRQPNKAALRGSEAAQALAASLEEERDVVHTFLYRVTEEVLTPIQEAWLDSQLHPWFPDVWSLCNLLAAQHGLPPAPEFPELEQGPPEFMPAAPPYNILKTPVAAYGMGLRLKSAAMSCIEACQDSLRLGVAGTVLEWHYLSTHRVSPISGLVYELPTIEHLREMTLYEAQVGTYRRNWKRDEHSSPAPGPLPEQRMRAGSPPAAAMSPCF